MGVVAPYGTWSSPLAAADLVQGAVGLGHPRRVGSSVVWQEARPAEKGRVALVAAADGGPGGGGATEVLPPDMSARTMVHEYGGRAWTVAPDGTLVTSNFPDQRLWVLPPAAPRRPLTPLPVPGTEARYACPAVTPDGRWVVCVRETHGPDGVVNDLVGVRLAGPATEPPVVLAHGHDFYSAPEISADGAHLAFVAWDHPNMPWDSTGLWRGRLADGGLDGLEAVVPAEAAESVLQPRWGPGGELYYVSDRSGWWNLYAGDRSLAPGEAEFGAPAWALGDSSYALCPDGALYATWSERGGGHLGLVEGGRPRAFDLPYTSFYGLSPAGATGADGVLAVAGSPRRAYELVRIGPDGGVDVVCPSQPRVLDEGAISVPRYFSFPTGAEGAGAEAYGTYYPPHNPAFAAPAEEKPPLIVTSHGGPTSRTSSVLNPRVQYWTSRGFAVVDVDYRGSSGYGRDFRRALEGQWGVADVDDCAQAARWVAARGWADPARLAIRGSSASGLTALGAVARSRQFACATSLYGVADLATLATGTHKFESRYVERLVPADEVEERSPLYHAAAIKAAVLLVQGLDDRVVPPEQSRAIFAQLRAGGTPVFLVEVEGEGHGFRRASTLVRAQEVELAFYALAFAFTPADDLSGARRDLERGATEAGARWE